MTNDNPKPKFLVVMDVDSTLIEQEVVRWRPVATASGLEPQ